MSYQPAAAPNKPWVALYTSELTDPEPSAPDLLALFRRAMALSKAGTAILYFDQAISYSKLDQLSDALAAALAEQGFVAGDRLGLYLQNMPQFLIGALAAWKLGGTAVPFNPMNRAFELGKILPDCRPKAVIAVDALAPHLREAVAHIDGYTPKIFLTSPLTYQTRNDERVLPVSEQVQYQGEEQNLEEILGQYQGKKPRQEPELDPHSAAFIVYTSGTTGVPKGAIITHDNMCWNTLTTESWMQLHPGQGPVLGLAPLFHITGLIAGLGEAWQLGEALVLNYRFHPQVMLDCLLEHQPSFTVGTITAYNALMSAPGSTREHFSSFKKLLSGGAPTPPSLAQAFYKHSGVPLHNGYGLTETTAGVTMVPYGLDAPVDEESGALSVGVAIYGADIWIAGDNDEKLGVGEVGEIVISSRAVSPGYWNKPKETAEAMRADGFRSGDVGLMDEQGWIYLVDRKKDMISASGYKVWPREVEDVLYEHPAVHEAAVVGIPDEYRGENVRAIVSLKPDKTIEEKELITWCRERMAAYKVPREVLLMDDLPKTPTGKILRRALKD